MRVGGREGKGDAILQDPDYCAAPASSSFFTTTSLPPSASEARVSGPVECAGEEKEVPLEAVEEVTGPPPDAVFEARVVIHEALHLPCLAAKQ